MIPIKFTTKEYDDNICKDETAPNDPLVDQHGYQRLIGKLLDLTMTRLDIANCVQTLSQFLQQPQKFHIDATIRVVRYIKKEPGLGGVLLSSQVKNEVTTYCDADWASYPNSRKSIL